ncbi:hypothetical protein BDN70DRAFT_895327 [Pholiota conissans]|uniref:Uncharacterized protein n=1 Tax=Pholiota conissans TaxID=109636 RepID=A0A9P5Z2J3_9AGAR|nr:hypothetical protein BDN70DRAFT_895327 [Pholiota conissans]
MYSPPICSGPETMSEQGKEEKMGVLTSLQTSLAKQGYKDSKPPRALTPCKTSTGQATMACKSAEDLTLALPEVMHIQAMHPASTSRGGATAGEEHTLRQWETHTKRSAARPNLDLLLKKASLTLPIKPDYTRVHARRDGTRWRTIVVTSRRCRDLVCMDVSKVVSMHKAAGKAKRRWEDQGAASSSLYTSLEMVVFVLSNNMHMTGSKIGIDLAELDTTPIFSPPKKTLLLDTRLSQNRLQLTNVTESDAT